MKSASMMDTCLKKTIAGFLCLCQIFLATNAYAAPLKVGTDFSKPVASVKFQIPETLGRVEETYTASPQLEGKKLPTSNLPRPTPTILFIQDAHDSLEAQENIAKIIRYLVERKGIQTVFEEGYEGPVPTEDFFGFIQDAGLREKVAYYLMDKLRIGGAEYAHVNRKMEDGRWKNEDAGNDVHPSSLILHSSSDFELVGIDSRTLHKQNMAWARKSFLEQKKIKADLSEALGLVKRLAHQRFPKDLKTWMRLKKNLDAGNMGLPDYLNRMVSMMKQNGIVFSDRAYPNLEILLHLSGKETKTDRNLSPSELFRELDELEDQFCGTMLGSKEDRKIFEAFQNLGLLMRLSRLEIKSEEFDLAQDVLKRFRTEDLAGFLSRETRKTVLLSKRWETLIQSAVRFYETAYARDQVMARTLTQHFKMKIRNSKHEKRNISTDAYRFEPEVKEAAVSDLEIRASDFVVLVAGGFHRARLCELFQKQGLSYQVITPSMTRVSEKHQKYYERLMSQGLHPFEMPLAIRRGVRAEPVFSLPFGREEVRMVYETLRPFERLARPLMIRETDGVMMRQGTHRSGRDSNNLGTPLGHDDLLDLPELGKAKESKGVRPEMRVERILTEDGKDLREVMAQVQSNLQANNEWNKEAEETLNYFRIYELPEKWPIRTWKGFEFALSLGPKSLEELDALWQYWQTKVILQEYINRFNWAWFQHNFLMYRPNHTLSERIGQHIQQEKDEAQAERTAIAAQHYQNLEIVELLFAEVMRRWTHDPHLRPSNEILQGFKDAGAFDHLPKDFEEMIRLERELRLEPQSQDETDETKERSELRDQNDENALTLYEGASLPAGSDQAFLQPLEAQYPEIESLLFPNSRGTQFSGSVWGELPTLSAGPGVFDRTSSESAQGTMMINRSELRRFSPYQWKAFYAAVRRYPKVRFVVWGEGAPFLDSRIEALQSLRNVRWVTGHAVRAASLAVPGKMIVSLTQTDRNPAWLKALNPETRARLRQAAIKDTSAAVILLSLLYVISDGQLAGIQDKDSWISDPQDIYTAAIQTWLAAQVLVTASA